MSIQTLSLTITLKTVTQTLCVGVRHWHTSLARLLAKGLLTYTEHKNSRMVPWKEIITKHPILQFPC